MVAKLLLLGRNAVLMVDGVALQSVQDASIRVATEEVDAHNGSDGATASVVVRRTIQVQFTAIDPRETRYLADRMELSFGQSPMPKLVLVTLLRGHITRSFYATIHDLEEDQPLRGAAGTRWLLKQWGRLPFQTLPGTSS